MEVIEIAVADLTLDPKNARTHNPRNIATIKASLSRFGQRKPIVIDDNNLVLAGNGTLVAARELGWDRIWAAKSHLIGGDAQAYALADNRTAELAEWDEGILKQALADLADLDIDMTQFGFDIEDDRVGNDGNGDPDDVPDEPKDVWVKPGDLFQLGDHRLLCGDSTKREDVERLMGGEKADLLLTDPPYGVSYADKNAFLNSVSPTKRIQERIENDHMSADEMNTFWDNVLENAHAACTDKSSYYIFSPQGGDLMMMMSIKHAGWQLKHMLVWVKNNHVLGRCDYNYKHEPVFFGWKEKGTHEFFGNGSCTSVLNFDKPLKNDLHPTMKPVELCEYLIRNSSRAGGNVLDIFCGSGSTLIACEKSDRSGYGLEMSPAYCQVILERWAKFSGKQWQKIE